MPVTLKLPDGRAIQVPDDLTPDEQDAIVAQEMRESEPVAEPPPQAPKREPEIAADVRAMPEGMAKQQLLHGVEGRTMPFAGNLGERASQIGPTLVKLAKRTYQGALKPTKAVLSKMPGGASLVEKEGQLAETGLREGVNVSKRGFEKTENLIDDLNTQVGSAISQSTASVPRAAVSSRLRDVTSRFKDQVTPTSDLRQISRVGKEFRKTQPPQIPVQEAQRLKQGTYRALKGKYGGELKSADMEAQKALARGLKDEIANAVPEVAPLNARETEVLSLKSALEDAMRRTGNRDVIGLTDVIAATSGRPGLLAATIGMRAPIQSGAARLMYRTGRSGTPDAAWENLLRAALLERMNAQE